MADEIWLALDIGTTGTKAALISADGHTLIECDAHLWYGNR